MKISFPSTAFILALFLSQQVQAEFECIDGSKTTCDTECKELGYSSGRNASEVRGISKQDLIGCFATRSNACDCVL